MQPAQRAADCTTGSKPGQSAARWTIDRGRVYITQKIASGGQRMYNEGWFYPDKHETTILR